MDVAVADFLFVSLLTMPTTSLVVFGGGHGNFPSNLALNAGNQTNKVSAVDVNSDGWADIVLMNDGSNDFDVFLNDRSGSFQVPYGFAVGITPATFEIADVDGDGRPDLITVTFAGIEVTFNRTTNSAPAATRHSVTHHNKGNHSRATFPRP